MTLTAILLTASMLAAGVGVTSVSAQAQAQESVSAPSEITVIAPRQRERSTTTGAPIETVSTSVVVNYSDLNLRTQAGQDELDNRIKAAARRACDWLNQLYPVTASGSPDCMATALDSARGQASQAIASVR